jgi:hypothetical protein
MTKAERYKRWYEKKKLTDPGYHKRRNDKRKAYFKVWNKRKYETNTEFQIAIRTRYAKNCWREGERELIENYEKAAADNFKGWMLHHRLECTLDGEFAHSAEELKRLDMYYNRPYYELIYLTNSEHSKLHFDSGHSLPHIKRSE